MTPAFEHDPCIFPLPPRRGYAIKTRRGFLARVGDDGLQPGQSLFLPTASGPDAMVFEHRDDADVWINSGEFLVAVWTVSEFVESTPSPFAASNRNLNLTATQCWRIESQWELAT